MNRLREITQRSKEAISKEERPRILKRFIKGWVNYFKLADMKGLLRMVDEWLRKENTSHILETVEEGKTRYRMIWQYNVPEWKVHELANCRKDHGAALMLNSILTNKKPARQGYITLSSYYEQICEN